jgi:NMD protein affecting ribosome stability and mRNA decay
MGKKKKPKVYPPCVYCGKEPGTTVDHVIAECFFDVTPPDAVKVPACGKCNNTTKSQMDVYVRDILVLDMRTDRHPVSQRIRQSTLRRSIKSYTSSNPIWPLSRTSR